MTYYISLLFELDKYKDRVNQIIESLPKGTKLILITKSRNYEINNNNNVKLIYLTNNIFNKSLFLKLKLVFLVFQYFFKGKVFILDWFQSFNYILFFKFLLKKRVVYIYAPVISNYGWIYKRFNNIVPNVGFRYDYIRGRESIQDYLTVKKCDYLIVQSKTLVDFYSEVYNIDKNKIKHNYNDYKINITQDLVIEPCNKIKLAFVGNLEKHKGINEMLEIFSKLDSTKFEIYLVGSAKGSNNLIINQKLNELPNVINLGFLNSNELRKIYMSIDALILLSYHEGSARVIREFVEYNKYIFMYNNPGMDYCVGLDGINIYEYKEVNKVLNDLENTNWNKKIERQIPSYIKTNNLKEILKVIE